MAIDEEANWTRAFVPGKPFQPSLIFVSEVGAYLSGPPKVRLYLQIFNLFGKVCHNKRSSLLPRTQVAIKLVDNIGKIL